MGAIKNVLYGTIGGSQTWSCGLWFAESGAGDTRPTQAALNTYAENVWLAWKAQAIKASPGILSICGTNVTFLGNRSYWYPSTGTQAFVKGQSSSASAVGTNPSFHPNQIAVCVSILTDTLGRSHRGRMYLPVNCATQNADGTFAAAQASAISTAMGNAISAINLIDLGSVQNNAYVRSQIPGVVGGPVTGVRCDNVADTIRARRDKVLATSSPYTSVVVG